LEEKTKLSVIVENKDWKLFKNADGTFDLVHTSADKAMRGITKADLLELQSIIDGAVAHA
jgi:SH3-like domain-containing protein